LGIFGGPEVADAILMELRSDEKKETGGTFHGLPRDAEAFVKAMQLADTGYMIKIEKMPPDQEFRDSMDAAEEQKAKKELVESNVLGPDATEDDYVELFNRLTKRGSIAGGYYD